MGTHASEEKEKLGPLNARAWLAGAVGIAIGLITVAVIAVAAGAL
ncbi:MAG: hypothetical protein ACO25O_04890 [Candidatus Limnocylindrus sp.]